MWTPLFWAGGCYSQGFTAAYWPFECWDEGSVLRKQLMSATGASLKNLGVFISCYLRFPWIWPFHAPTCFKSCCFLWHSSGPGELSCNSAQLCLCRAGRAGFPPVLKSEHLNNFLPCFAFLGVNSVGASVTNSFSFPWQKVSDSVFWPPQMVTAMLKTLGESLLLSSSVWGEQPSRWAKKPSLQDVWGPFFPPPRGLPCCIAFLKDAQDFWASLVLPMRPLVVCVTLSMCWDSAGCILN